MVTTTDFNSWLDQADPDTTEEIYALHEAVSLEEDTGIWGVKKEGGRIIITAGHVEDALVVPSGNSKNTFLELIRKQYMGGDFDAESWYGYQRNMDNPKA